MHKLTQTLPTWRAAGGRLLGLRYRTSLSSLPKCGRSPLHMLSCAAVRCRCAVAAPAQPHASALPCRRQRWRSRSAPCWAAPLGGGPSWLQTPAAAGSLAHVSKVPGTGAAARHVLPVTPTSTREQHLSSSSSCHSDMHRRVWLQSDAQQCTQHSTPVAIHSKLTSRAFSHWRSLAHILSRAVKAAAWGWKVAVAMALSTSPVPVCHSQTSSEATFQQTSSEATFQRYCLPRWLLCGTWPWWSRAFAGSLHAQSKAA